jgi:hypothetical protein
MRSVALSLAVCLGCAHSVPVETPRQAVCAYERGEVDYPVVDARVPARLRFAAEIVGADEQRELFGRELPQSFDERAVLVRLRYASDAVDLDRVELRPRLRVDGEWVELTPDAEALAELTGETVPTEVPPVPDRMAGARAILGALLSFLLLPVAAASPDVSASSLAPRRSRPPRWRRAPHAVRSEAAPLATGMEDGAPTCDGRPGLTCEGLAIIPRTGSSLTEMSLLLSVVYAEDRPPDSRYEEAARSQAHPAHRCFAVREHVVALEAATTMEERIRASLPTSLTPLTDFAEAGAAY